MVNVNLWNSSDAVSTVYVLINDLGQFMQMMRLTKSTHSGL